MDEIRKYINLQGLCNSLAGPVILAIICLNHCAAQQRNADSIFTVRKDTLAVRIIEVGIDAVKYSGPGADSIRIQLLGKSEIIKVIYGNGETERFETPARFPVSESKYGYFKPVKITPFQQSLSGWSNDLLITKRNDYQTTANVALVTGVITSAATPILLVAGIVNSIFDDGRRGVPFLIGGLAGVGASVSLFLGSAKTRKKARLVKMELIRRGVGGY